MDNIGYVNKENRCDQGWLNSVWCSHRDVTALFAHALEATAEPGYGIYYGISANRHRWVDMRETEARLGFVARDSAEEPPRG